MEFTIDDAKRVQRDLRLGGRHVAYVDPDEGFVLAHTDAERARRAPLHRCPVHRWLNYERQDNGYTEPQGDLFREAGWYEITGLGEARRLVL